MMFSWHQIQWQQINQMLEIQRLPHALLLTGLAGLGKNRFAHALTQRLLCTSIIENQGCNRCHACRLLSGRTHPNVLWIEPEKAGQAIKVDQVRALNEFIYHSSLQGNDRVVIITPAHSMNMQAANALLKTLEEPARSAFVILISDQFAQLPATILSRCQRINFYKPDEVEALAWLREQAPTANDLPQLLQLAMGAPLAALALQETEDLAVRVALFDRLCALHLQQADPLLAATLVEKQDPLKIVDWVISWVIDLLYVSLNGEIHVKNRDFASQLATLKANLSLKTLLHYTEYLFALRTHLCQGINLNSLLLLENLLIRWQECAYVSR